MIHCLRIGKKSAFVLRLLKAVIKIALDRLSLQQLEYEMERADIPDDYNCFEIGNCGHPAFPYAHIQLDQATKLIPSHFQVEYNPFIHDILNNKNTQLVWLYFVYRPNINELRTDPTNDDQKSYAFAPTYGDGSTAFHHSMISVVVYSYSNELQSILADYAFTEIVCFDDY